MIFHCWLRWQRHSWEWHLGSQGLFEYPTCKHCGWPGPVKLWRRVGF